MNYRNWLNWQTDTRWKRGELGCGVHPSSPWKDLWFLVERFIGDELSLFDISTRAWGTRGQYVFFSLGMTNSAIFFKRVQIGTVILLFWIICIRRGKNGEGKSCPLSFLLEKRISGYAFSMFIQRVVVTGSWSELCLLIESHLSSL